MTLIFDEPTVEILEQDSKSLWKEEPLFEYYDMEGSEF